MCVLEKIVRLAERETVRASVCRHTGKVAEATEAVALWPLPKWLRAVCPSQATVAEATEARVSTSGRRS